MATEESSSQRHGGLVPEGSIKRILVAVDESPRAAEVVAAAVELARVTGASIRLFQAVSVPAQFPPAAHIEYDDALPQYLRQAALGRLEALLVDVRDVPCETRVEESFRPWSGILEAAEAYDADLIVLGSHGYTMMDRVLGTTAARVTDHARRNVFVVHRPLDTPAGIRDDESGVFPAVSTTIAPSEKKMSVLLRLRKRTRHGRQRAR